MKALEHELKALDEKIDYFKALKTQATEQSGTALLNEETSFERVTAIADYIQTQLNNAYEQHRDVGYRWFTVNEEMKAVQIRLADDDPQQNAAGASHPYCGGSRN